jgi:broad specificity phosphatase PhoE
MRHGESVPNHLGIIISDPANAIQDKYGITALGRNQSRDAAIGSSLTRETVICTSDFSRHLETAEIAREVLGVSAILISELLRERFFGRHEGTSNANYQKVWDADRKNAEHTENGVESVISARSRTVQQVLDLETVYSNRDILIVSSGDPLQILQTAFRGIDPTMHRSLPHWPPAEIRAMPTTESPALTNLALTSII